MSLYEDGSDELEFLKAGHKRLKAQAPMTCALIPASDNKVYVILRQQKRFKQAKKLKPLVMKAKAKLKESGVTAKTASSVYGLLTLGEGRTLQFDVQLGTPSKIPQVHKKLKDFAKEHKLVLFKKVEFVLAGETMAKDADDLDPELTEEEGRELLAFLASDVGSVDLSELEEREDAEIRASLSTLSAAMKERLGETSVTERLAALRAACGEDFASGLGGLDECMSSVMAQLEDLQSQCRVLGLALGDLDLMDVGEELAQLALEVEEQLDDVEEAIAAVENAIAGVKEIVQLSADPRAAVAEAREALDELGALLTVRLGALAADPRVIASDENPVGAKIAIGQTLTSAVTALGLGITEAKKEVAQ